MNHSSFIVNQILSEPFLGETRDGKETQRGHVFDIRFKLPIVNDGIQYKNDQNKSEGYSLNNGKKSIMTNEQIIYRGNMSKKILQKVCSIPNHSTVTDCFRMDPYMNQ